LLEKGFVDQIVDRRRQRAYIAALLRLHTEPHTEPQRPEGLQ
jgi:acetyl-CoA carboxylase beta subunit